MRKKELEEILNRIADKHITVAEAIEELRFLPFTDLGFAKTDNHRSLRTGHDEVIFCLGKTASQIGEIARELGKSGSFLATKADPSHFEAIRQMFPSAEYHNECGLITYASRRRKKTGFVLILTAGTADQPIALEASITAEFLGSRVERIFDVGVSGFHRLLAFKQDLIAAQVIIVTAGMDGALPGLVAGLVSVPVIAVPSSIGYGASFEGLAALLTMLNACAPGVSVVNIDNGFGAGYLAHIINRGSSGEKMISSRGESGENSVL